jgi:hypothetical protein
VFFGAEGRLDHGLTNAAARPFVTGAAAWHINADEPRGKDYTFFNQPALYEPGPYRSSDHDPVLIGLAVDPADAIENKSGELQDIVDANPRTRLADKIEDAQDKLDEALEKLGDGDEQGALGSIDGAVGDLGAAGDGRLFSRADGTRHMDDLSGIARYLAAAALAEATACDPDDRDLAVARRALADGDARRTAGRFKDAVNKYKDALAKADGVRADC